jgi:hypothetical protein
VYFIVEVISGKKSYKSLLLLLVGDVTDLMLESLQYVIMVILNGCGPLLSHYPHYFFCFSPFSGVR